MVGSSKIEELRSEEVEEVLTRPPHKLIRYGISVICGIVLLLFVGCFFFKYPDIVTGEVTITTQKPPVWLIARSSGYIKELRCIDNQMINKGDLIAVIDNTAKTDDVLFIDSILNKVIISDTLFYVPSFLSTKTYELGDIQSNFSSFIGAAVNLNDFLSINLTKQEQKSIEKQIYGRVDFSKSLETQLELKNKELILAKEDLERDKQLLKKGVISKSEFNSSEQIFLNLQQSYQQLKSSILSESVSSVQINETLKKLSLQYSQDKNQFVSEFLSTKRELSSAIELWKKNYLLISSIDGRITFNSYWQKDQFIENGKKVFAVVSDESNEMIGKISIPSSGMGKVKKGQSVNLKINGYPYLQFGIVKAKITNISLVTNENGNYTVEVKLINGLLTTTNRVLDFKGELFGEAEIITDDRSLGQRFVDPLLHIWNDKIK